MWYQFNPNTELLKQANVWNGLSQSIKDFFEGADRNELLKLNRQNTQINMDKTRQDMQHQAEMHPLTMQGLQTQNNHNAHRFKMASLYDEPMYNADLAHKRALTNYTNKQAAHIGSRGNNALEIAKAFAGIAKNFSKSPAQMQQEREDLKQHIIKQYPFLSDNADIVEQMVSDYMTYGTHNKPDNGLLYDSYEALADSKKQEELDELRRQRMQSDPTTQFNQAILQLLGLQGGMLGAGIYAPPTPQVAPRKDSPNEINAANTLKLK